MSRLLSGLRLPGKGEVVSICVERGRIAEVVPGALPDGEDRSGHWVLPGFVDAHCHILPTGLDLQRLHLGDCDTPEAVLDRVAERHRELPDGEWLQAVHYDQTRFPTGEHLTATELDAISDRRPILLRHSNGHASVANTAALRAAGIDENVTDPPGGTFVRTAEGKLSGVLLERAHEIVTAAAPAPTFEEMVDAILRAGRAMRRLGITTATDMMTGRWDLETELRAYTEAARRGCPIRIRLCLQWGAVLGSRALDSGRLHELIADMDPDTCGVIGLKIFADGAIGSATAAIYGRYRGSTTSRPLPDGRIVDGQLIYPPERLRAMVRTAHDAGWEVAVHAIGDYAVDLVLDAFAATSHPGRHRIEHAMLLSDEQIERMAALGCHCTMQPEFLMRFGHAYTRQLGPERAASLARFRSVLAAGVPLSLSSDRPIVPGDPWDGLLTAERRPEGFSSSENLPREYTIPAYTEMGAIANADDDRTGRIAPGYLADLQIYADDPLGPGRPRLVETLGPGREDP